MQCSHPARIAEVPGYQLEFKKVKFLDPKNIRIRSDDVSLSMLCLTYGKGNVISCGQDPTWSRETHTDSVEMRISSKRTNIAAERIYSMSKHKVWVLVYAAQHEPYSMA